MELHQRSCVLPSNAPALPKPDSSIPSRVLQERSGNRRHGYADPSSSWKRSSSPVENFYTHRSGGSYFSSNLVAQLSCEKSEDQISYETRRLLQSLQRCEKYRKYRDRQPQNAKERELKWPDNMEEAFFRALVRWPPMGRRKLMHDGSLRGRNELVADSIYKETSLPRTRKQVSSHIQVLKNFFIDQPNIAIYMSTEDMGSKRSRHASSHLNHLRGRQGLGSSASRYGSPSQAGAGLWDGLDYLPSSSHGLGKLQSIQEDPSYTVTDFALWISDEKKHPTHYLSQLAKPSRHVDLNVVDLSSWQKQYREFEFMRAEGWKDRQVLVCDASIKVMTDPQPPGAELSTQFLLKSSKDLSAYDSLQCRTRFYDSGELADQGPKEGPSNMETIGKCSYDDKTGHALIPFGSNFWVKRTSKLSSELRQAKRCEETSQRSKMEMSVRRSLQYLTAMQDIWGTMRDTGDSVCLLTILWRFHQISNESGKMKWRVVNFRNLQDQRWIKHEHSDNKGLADMVTSAAATSIYTSLPLDFSQHPFPHPPHLDLESLNTSALEVMSDFSNPNSATAPTDYSQTHSIPSLTHSHDSSLHPHPHDYHNANDLDFTGGHINICLEPAINLGAYETHLHTPSLNSHANPLHALAEYDHTAHDNFEHATHHDSHTADADFADLGLGLQMQSCYPTRPTWAYQDLISRFEGIAEQTQHDFHSHPSTHQEAIAGHGVLHDGQMHNGLWKLQTGFGDDTGVGARMGVGVGVGGEGRKDSALEVGHGQAILDMIGKRDWRDV
ncbi:TEA/ATTS domain family-domain-containing protein [Lophiotrema nucula]|uniref:TEA/ATTS domain family-domain-containing protein n=1 Tax=Lophiotrema nucula TaxID=690887 RepID=A0A6A5YKY6_9PLEO|nr:TEA/ATTS domain family-domain-containing protein [Lophiotrema nucula]